MALIYTNRKSLNVGLHGDIKGKGLLTPHLDDVDLHRDHTRVTWTTPIGAVTATTAMGFHFNLTALAASGTVTIESTTGSGVRLYCSAASGSFCGIRRTIPALRADSPTVEVVFRLATLGNAEFRLEFYKDADEYCYIKTSGSAVRYGINDKSGATSGALLAYDDDINEPATALVIAKDTWYRWSLHIDTDGCPWLINHLASGEREIFTLPTTETNRLTADAHYAQARVYATKGTVADGFVRCWEDSRAKLV